MIRPAAAAFGTIYDRHVETKNKYDPRNFYRLT